MGIEASLESYEEANRRQLEVIANRSFALTPNQTR